MTAFYNERDPYAAQWLRNLIAAGHIAPGVVSEEDVRDLRPIDLMPFTQVHLFAGIGIWSLSLRAAGVFDDTPFWSASCPCQPFSAAGRSAGFDDERHLWPHTHWLISQCRPPRLIGEQVASKDGLGWLDLVSADMEGSGYAFGAVDICAAGFGVEWQESDAGQWLRRAIHDCTDPSIAARLRDFADWAGAGNLGIGGSHIRQRLYFVAVADSHRELHAGTGARGPGRRAEYPDCEPTGSMADAGSAAGQRDPGSVSAQEARIGSAHRSVDGDCAVGHGHGGPTGSMANASSPRPLPGAQPGICGREEGAGSRDGESERSGTACQLADALHTGRPERGTVAGDRQATGSGTTGGMDHHHHPRSQGHAWDGGAAGRQGPQRPASEAGVSGGLGDTSCAASQRDTGEFSSEKTGSTGSRNPDGRHDHGHRDAGPVIGLGQPEISRPADWQKDPRGSGSIHAARSTEHGIGHTGADGQRPNAPDIDRGSLDWIFCRDGKWRAVESSVQPLADGPAGSVGPVRPAASFPLTKDAHSRVGRLRAYGNGLDAQTATGFIEAVVDVLDSDLTFNYNENING